MTELLALLQLPFVQRAIIGGGLVAITASLMGVLVVLRKSAFYGDAVAHASLTGVAIGLLLGWQPLVTAAGYAVLISVALPWLHHKSRLPIDSLLGFILPVSMAAGVLLLAINPGFQPDLISFLFGSILSVGQADIWMLLALTSLILGLFTFFRRQLLFSSFDPTYAKISGVSVHRIQLLYQVLLALTIVASIQVVGIVLVNALLIIPASITRLFARSLSQMLWLTPAVAVGVTGLGILLSLVLDLPTGPSIALVAGAVLIAAMLWPNRASV